MKVPSPKLPTRGDIPDVPEDARYLEDYFGPRDKMIEDIIAALQGRLSPKDNMNYERRELLMYHGVAQNVLVQNIHGMVSAVQVEQVDFDDYYKLKWEPLGQDTVKVTISFDTAPGDPKLVRLGIWGD